MAAQKGFHINKNTGRTGVCHATKKGCPVGGAPEDHFDTKEEAQAELEKRNEAKYGKTATHKRTPAKPAALITPAKDALRRAKSKINKLSQGIAKQEREADEAKKDMLENGSKGLKRANLAILENNISNDKASLSKLRKSISKLEADAEREAEELDPAGFTTVDEGRLRAGRLNQQHADVTKKMKDIENKIDSNTDDATIDSMSKEWKQAKTEQRAIASRRRKVNARLSYLVTEEDKREAYDDDRLRSGYYYTSPCGYGGGRPC